MGETRREPPSPEPQPLRRWRGRTRGEQQTRDLAARLAAGLESSDIVALFGDLGSGKTRFVEGACRGLGYAGRVRSPTFVLLHIYRGRLPIHHFDLYRWDPAGTAADLEEWEELMEGPGVSFIEWAERLGPALPARAIRVRLDHAGGEEREVELAAPSSLWSRLEPCLPCEDEP